MSPPNELTAWLAARRPAAPEPLREALERALAAASTPSLPAAAPPTSFPAAASPETRQLTEAAIAALRRSLELGDERAAAWELLGADALLTYAIERAAEEGTEPLAALVGALTPAALAEAVGLEAVASPADAAPAAPKSVEAEP